MLYPELVGDINTCTDMAGKRESTRPNTPHIRICTHYGYQLTFRFGDYVIIVFFRVKNQESRIKMKN